ncbi:MAG: DUF4167 domain-containing protein [Alphaproteobacteria bacterium]
MGMNPRGRSRGRSHNNFNNNRRFNNGPTRNTVYDSIGPAGRLRGTAFQLMEKYLSAAKEQMSSDRVLAESCLQHADHYMRLNALAIAAEGARFASQNQPEPESSEPVENDAAETLPAADTVENEPVVVSFIPAAPEPEDTSLNETVKMDLSVPVSVMVENEMKAKRGRPPMKKAPAQETAGAVAVVKRRGRPPVKKTIEAEA